MPQPFLEACLPRIAITHPLLLATTRWSDDGTAGSTPLGIGPARACTAGVPCTGAPSPGRTHILMPRISTSLAAPAESTPNAAPRPVAMRPHPGQASIIHWLPTCDRLSNIRCTCQAPGLAWLEGGGPSGCCQPCCAALRSARLRGTGSCTWRLRLHMMVHMVV